MGVAWRELKLPRSYEGTILKSPEVNRGTRHEYVQVPPQPNWKSSLFNKRSP
jgi:hypothetical protein